MEKKVRVRFAPSPTGYLHIGGLRTVLFNYLIAKSLGGKIILRIEDTDQKREVAGAAKALAAVISWAGIEFDESPDLGGDFGPYVQTERLEIYQKYIKQLIDDGKAYHCFCSAERLEKVRLEQQSRKEAPRYDRCCRDLTKTETEQKLQAGESFVIRQKMPTEGEVKAIDELRGEINFSASDLQDHVLMKSDGIPTYQFASVVDDHLMEISHVVRGDEWIPSLPKNVLLYQAFSWDLPKFVHLPLVMNKEGGKLSKRQGDVAVEDFRAKGYLPEALLNFMGLLGWHPKGDEEVMNMSEMIGQFKIADIGTSAAVFDVEKLNYFNGVYIRKTSLDKLVELCLPYLTDNLKLSLKEYKRSTEFIKKVIKTQHERLVTLNEVADLTQFFFVDKLEYDPELLVWKKMSDEDKSQIRGNLQEILDIIKSQDNWTGESLEKAVIAHIKSNDKKIGNYLWPMRVALSGLSQSPGPFEIFTCLGKEESIERIKKAITNFAPV